tara:strand:+ start:367 stop:699 length:333 start_codon:yes stop_codon:yes gene_type:complete
MVGGMFAGAGASAVMDTMKYDEKCDNARNTLKSMNKMKTFYDEMMSNANKTQAEYEGMLKNMAIYDKESKEKLKFYTEFLKKEHRTTQIIMSTSICIICSLFIIKYFFGN